MPDTQHPETETPPASDTRAKAKAPTSESSTAANGGPPAQDAGEIFDAAAKQVGQGKTYSDVALAGLCQSYAHALSMAFQEAVLQQQRRSSIAQAAVAAALARVDGLEEGKIKDHLQDVQDGLKIFGLSDADNMAVFANITEQFQNAADRLLQVRKQADLD
ncbi:RebB family R body protein [Kordiimonas lacus]|uniref:Killing trait domain-containing protein n=1 Tax=Kordiimonas lacus TaxID=637679 RepID=A0A1G7CBM6_9PROT|nr:RebB family R body protein [Kordiimonas lacus]SDE36130.1 Killing trait domain-containing protein [Kordiimonas lacus]